MTDQRKHLVLHIEIPGFYADDLDDCAAIYAEPDPPGPRERLDVVTEEWMRAEVGITLVSLPGEKCMNDDFEVTAYTGRIVGAETRDVAEPEKISGEDPYGEYQQALDEHARDATPGRERTKRKLDRAWCAYQHHLGNTGAECDMRLDGATRCVHAMGMSAANCDKRQADG